MFKKFLVLFALLFFLLGIVQAATQAVLTTSVPVETQIKGFDNMGTTFSFLEANWQRNELYVSYATGITVIDTVTWQVKTKLPLQKYPSGMCISPTGEIATTSWGSPLDDGRTVTVTNPANGVSWIWSNGLPLSASYCSFSPDGSKLYMAIRDGNFLTPKIAAIDPGTGQVLKTWRTNENFVRALKVMPNGKVYATAFAYDGTTFSSGSLYIISPDDNIKSVGVSVGGSAINIAPNGNLAYINGLPTDGTNSWKTVIFDITTEQATSETIWLPSPYYAWPSQDVSFAYLAGESGAVGRELIGYNPTVIVSTSNTEKNFGLAARQQTEGVDTVVLLRSGKVDVFKAVRFTPSLRAVVDAAGFRPGVAPGSLIALYGWKMGPTAGALAEDLNGVPVLGQMKVWVQDSSGFRQSIPLLFTSENQINARLPKETSIGAARVSVEGPGGLSTNSEDIVVVNVQQTSPGIFVNWNVSTGEGVVFDKDNQLVSLSNPAKRGFAVNAYAIGLGPLAGTPTPPLSIAIPCSLPVTATVGGIPAQVSWAGTSLFLPVSGIYTVNVKVPENSPTGLQKLQIFAGGKASNEVMLMVK